MGEFFGVVLPTATSATQKTTMAVDDAAGQGGQATIVTQSVLNSSARKLRSGHFSVERDNLRNNNYDR